MVGLEADCGLSSREGLGSGLSMEGLGCGAFFVMGGGAFFVDSRLGGQRQVAAVALHLEAELHGVLLRGTHNAKHASEDKNCSEPPPPPLADTAAAHRRFARRLLFFRQ